MNKFFIILGILAIAAYIYFADFSPPNNELLDKINELEYKIDSLNNKKDSIITVIDSTHIKIITNEQHYKEVVNTILSQSSNDDYEFITEYIRIRQYSNKGDSVDLR